MNGPWRMVDGARTVNGCGHQGNANGRRRGARHACRNWGRTFTDGLTSTNFSVHSGATLSNPSEVGRDGRVETLLKATGTSVGSLASIYYDFSAVTPGPEFAGLSMDVWVKPESSFTPYGNTGASFYIYLLDSAMGAMLTWDVQLPQGFWKILLFPANASATGGANWSTTSFRWLRCRKNAVSGITNEFKIGDIRFLRMANKAIICPRSDDGGLSNYSWFFGQMRANNMVGDLGVIRDAIGSGLWAGYDRMTQAQIDEMVGAGWGALDHTISHGSAPFLTTANQAACEAQMNSALSRVAFIAPYGEITSPYVAAAKAQGYNVFWGTGLTGAQTKLAGIMGPQFIETDGIVYQMMALPVNYNTSRSFFDSQLDAACASGAIFCPLYHHFAESHGSVSIVRAYSDALADIASMRAKIECGAAVNRNFAEALRMWRR